MEMKEDWGEGDKIGTEGKNDCVRDGFTTIIGGWKEVGVFNEEWSSKRDGDKRFKDHKGSQQK